MTHLRTKKVLACDLFSLGKPFTRRNHLISEPISNERTKSMIPRKPAIMNTATITTTVDPITSLRLGHVTFLVSAWTSCKKVVTRSAYSRMTYDSQVKFQCSRRHKRVLEAGQEGFEPPTPGFGVRCSSRSSYWPVSGLRALRQQAVSFVSLGDEHAQSYRVSR
jgi:hypothetical protein